MKDNRQQITVAWLCERLTPETWVTIKYAHSGRVFWEGFARLVKLQTPVKDWDFSNGHSIYI